MRTMFRAEIIAILSAVVLIIPLLGTGIGLIGILAGFVLSRVGLHTTAHLRFLILCPVGHDYKIQGPVPLCG